MISVVMPVYNEGARLGHNLERTLEVMRPVGPFEIIPANDGSTDNSAEVIDASAKSHPEIKPLHLPHAGKGEALRRGTEMATGDWVIFIDADLDLPPEQILFFIALQKAKKADAVIGSKMHPDSTIDYPLRRRIYSFGYYLLVKTLFGLPIRDTQTGLKLVRKSLLIEALRKTELTGFAFDLELLVRLVDLQAVMVEAPVVVDFHHKFGGIGKKDAIKIATDTWVTWKTIRASRKINP